jgi:competence protein ComEA
VRRLNRLRFYPLFAGLAIVVVTIPADVQAAAPKEWITMQNCQLVTNPANDGDSFRFRYDNTEYLARLYFVDSPETEGGVNAGRLIEQAKYFALSVPQVVEIGEKAKLFTQSKLAEPFTFVTRKASGLGRSEIERFYGFVQTKDGDLGELLAANGLARVHGTRAVRPGTSNAAEEIRKLEELEQQARRAKVGGWSGSVGAAGSTPQPIQTIRPQPSSPTTATPAAAPRALPSVHALPTASAKQVPSISESSAKLDINTATAGELQKIPGIGKAMAERIIAARPFETADDLKNVKGVGNGKKYEQIRPYFR